MFSKFGLDLASWSKVIVLGKEQEDDDTQKDFCARGRALHGWVIPTLQAGRDELS